jgi:hypothetical protein
MASASLKVATTIGIEPKIRKMSLARFRQWLVGLNINYLIPI